MSLELTVPDSTTLQKGFDALEQAIVIKESVLDAAAAIAVVDTPEANVAASAVQGQLADYRKAITKAHEEAKAPFLKICQQLDAKKREMLAETTPEESRITKVLGDFHQLQEAKRQAAIRAAQLEAERIERLRREEEMRILREQQERERKEREAAEALERKAKAEADEAARKVAQAKNAEARARAEKEAKIKAEAAERERIELDRQRELAAAQTHAQLDAAQERASNAQAAIPVAAEPVRAQGQQVIDDWDIKVDNIWLLAKAHPICVKIEPLVSEIKNLIKAGVKVAGVTATPIKKARNTGKGSVINV
jgi:colicin import membrane protein